MRKNNNWERLAGPANVGFSCGRQAGAAVTVEKVDHLAAENGWQVIRMKNDWERVFGFKKINESWIHCVRRDQRGV